MTVYILLAIRFEERDLDAALASRTAAGGRARRCSCRARQRATGVDAGGRGVVTASVSPIREGFESPGAAARARSAGCGAERARRAPARTPRTGEAEMACDPARAERFAAKMLGALNGAALGLMISIGHRTGLFDVMRDLAPASPAEIAS